MNWKISIFKDRDYLASLPLTTQSIIKKDSLLTSGRQNVSYCGLLFHGNQIDVFLPRNSKCESSESEKCRLASLVLKTIQKYGNEYDSPLTLDDGEIENQLGGTSLSLIANIMNDYKRNGIYSTRRSLKALSSGKPNWNKTISKGVAYPCRNNFIYLDIHSSKKSNQSLCEVAKIQKLILEQLCKKFSQLLFGQELKVTEQNIPNPTVTSIESQIYILEKELRSAFSERDIWLIKALKRYLESIKGDSESNMVIGIKHFHTVWEFMLSRTLSHTVNVNGLIPIPSYRLNDGTIESASAKGQRLDVVLKHPENDSYAVVDAKYYSASNISSAPGWPDLVKQFFYAKALKELLPNARITNSFIFPNECGPLQSAHMKERSSKRLLDTEYGAINCHYVDPLFVMECFVSNEKLVKTSNELLL